MKRIIYILTLVFATAFPTHASSPLAEKYGSFSVIGDSYSTFKGFNDPIANVWFYPRGENDVTSVDQTWWKLFERESGIRLEQNNSFSGSAVCTHHRNNTTDLYNSFVGRVGNLREAGLIIIEGATNDNTFKAPMGEYVWSGFTDAQKRTYRGGTAYVIDFLKRKYPKSTIIFMLNSGLSNDINTSTEEICKHYEIPLLKLGSMSRKLEHPDVEGMKTINSELLQFLYGMEGITYMSEKTPVSITEVKENARVMVDKRINAGEWTSVCFPFSLSEAQMASIFGKDTQVQTVEAVEGTEVKLAPAASMQANRPYVIRPTRNLHEPFLIEGVKLEQTNPAEIGQGRVIVNGLYRPREGRLSKVYYYTFDRSGALYNNSTKGWTIPALSVAVKTLNTVKLCGAVQGYDAPSIPEITFDKAFTPANTGFAAASAIPVFVASPYLSVWSERSVLSAGATKHLSGIPHPVEGYLEVDGKFYRFLGAATDDVKNRLAPEGEFSEATQKALHVTATQTFVGLEAGGVNAVVVFSAPQLIDDARSLDASVNYMSYRVESTDGTPHSVKIHLVLPGTMVAESLSTVVYSEDKTSGFTVGRIGSDTSVIAANPAPLFGHISVIADAAKGQKIDNINGNILLFSDDMGSTAAASGCTVIGHDDGLQAMGSGNACFPAPWRDSYRSFGCLMADMALQVNERLEACRAFDEMISKDAEEAGAEEYAAICRAVYRQVTAVCKSAVSGTGSVLLYNLDAGATNHISNSNTIFLTAPLLLAYNPELAYRMVASVPDYVSTYPGYKSESGSAPLHLGDWPVMNGANFAEGVEASTGLCIIAYAAVVNGMPADVIDDYAYNYFVGLCKYLDRFSKPEYEADLAQEVSADGLINDNANLRLKCILAMHAMQRLAALRGNSADADMLLEMAKRWEKGFRGKYDDFDHYMQGSSLSWGLKYPLFYDRALGLNLFADVIGTELNYYLTQPAGEYGRQLNAASNTVAKVSATMLTAALDDDNFSTWIAPVAAYFGIGKESCGDARGLISDEYNCRTGDAISGAGNPALGSVWARVLLSRCSGSAVSEIDSEESQVSVRKGIYDLFGRPLSRVCAPGIYIIDGRKTLIRR